MMNIIPQPKSIENNGEALVFLPKIKCDCCFAAAEKAFISYVQKYHGVTLEQGTGGFEIKAKAELSADEYEIDGKTAYASATEGANYAFATFLQMMSTENGLIKVFSAKISDKPDCSHRTLMIDLARKFHPVEFLTYYVDLCYLYKVNRFQLHLTDDQGFTFPSDAFPNLISHGEFYTKKQLSDLVEYANDRGVVLIPEVDIPGHCALLQKYHPEVFGSCGVLPASEKVFEALATLYGEVSKIFVHSPYIHIGGDEAAVSNWQEDNETLDYMKNHDIADNEDMYTEFIRRTTEIIFALGKTPIVWEGFHKSGNSKISKNVIVISWENYYQPVYDLAESKFTLINASWKPLYIVTPNTHWSPEEILNLSRFSWRHWWENSKAFPDGIDISHDNNVIGMQLCAWGDVLQTYEDGNKAAHEEYELVRERVPAMAEKNWNNDTVRSIDDFNTAYATLNKFANIK